MRNLYGLQGGDLAHVLSAILRHRVLYLQVVPVDQAEPGIRGDLDGACRQDGDAPLPGNHIGTWRGGREMRNGDQV